MSRKKMTHVATVVVPVDDVEPKQGTVEWWEWFGEKMEQLVERQNAGYLALRKRNEKRQSKKQDVWSAVETGVTCDGCGVCCMHLAVPPYDVEERALLQEYLPEVYKDLLAVERTRTLQLRVSGEDSVPCAFFDWVRRACKHHDHNPVACDRFEVGGPDCLDLRKDAGLD